MSLVDVQEIDNENKRFATFNNTASTLIAIAQMRWNGERTTAPHFHTCNTLVPARNDLACTEAKFKCFIAIPACIELLSGAPRNAHIVHLYIGALSGFLACSHSEVFNDEVCRWVR